MIGTLRRRVDWRWLTAAMLVAGVSTALGVMAALRAGEHGDQPLSRVASEAAAVGPNGEPQVVAADPSVEFPAVLRDLPNPPSHLAIDQKTGDLWFLIFTYDGKSNVLYHYTPSDGNVETFDIPSSGGSELYSAISIDSRGHVISAEGDVVTDLDPLSQEITQLKLPEPTVDRLAYSPSDGPWILDMAISENGSAYLSRMNIPAITELDISTGKSREISYPASFGPAYDIELGKDGLWMTSRWDIARVSSAQTGRIEPASGEFVAVGGGTTAISAGRGGSVVGLLAASQDAATDLVDISVSGVSPEQLTSATGGTDAIRGLGLRDFLSVDSSGVAWFVGEGSDSISRFDPSSGGVRMFRLPAYGEYRGSCPFGVDCPDAALQTRVRGLAVAPDGDVYFSDATMNRIGVIHVGE